MTAEELAQRILEKYGIVEPPVNVDEIARAEGIQIARNHFEGSQSGFAYRDRQVKIIGVNTSTSRRRQRFTVAHELGHLLLHEGKPLIVDHSVRLNFRDEASSLGTHRQEIQANTFAAALLMPKDMVIRGAATWIESEDLAREELIVRLSRTFDVSAEAIGYRLINLGILAA